MALKRLARHKTLPLLLALSGMAVLPGCAAFSDMKPAKFTCGLPKGIGCKPVSEVYRLSGSGGLAAATVAPAPKADSGKAASPANNNNGGDGGALVFANAGPSGTDDLLGLGGGNTCRHKATTARRPPAAVAPPAPAGAQDADAQDAQANSGNGNAALETVAPGNPILTRPRQIRIWVGRWEDKDGDLHDETYLYLRLDDGRWLLQ